MISCTVSACLVVSASSSLSGSVRGFFFDGRFSEVLVAFVFESVSEKQSKFEVSLYGMSIVFGYKLNVTYLNYS